VFTHVVVWFCCYSSEGPYSLWLACCSVVCIVYTCHWWTVQTCTNHNLVVAQATKFSSMVPCMFCIITTLFFPPFCTEMCFGWKALSRELHILVKFIGHSGIVGSQYVTYALSLFICNVIPCAGPRLQVRHYKSTEWLYSLPHEMAYFPSDDTWYKQR